MTRRYELTDQEWEQIASLFPPEKNGKPGRPSKDNRLMINAMVWIARSGAPWRDLPERYGSWKTVYSRSRKWIEDGILDNIFRVLCLEAGLEELFLDASIVRRPPFFAPAQCRCKKRGPANETGHSRGGSGTKIHAVVDAYGYPVYLMLGEGQRNDINFSIPMLEQINIDGSQVVADRGYDSTKLLDYIYGRNGSQRSRPEMEPNLSATVTGSFIRSAIWLRNFFLS